jgi:hypothetical protein
MPTEARWLACTDALKLWRMLRVPDDRLLRLYICACCRRFWHLLIDERSRHAVETCELFLDDRVSRQAYWSAWDAAATVCAEREADGLTGWPFRRTTRAARIAAAVAQRRSRPYGMLRDALLLATRHCHRGVLAAIGHCIYGNPFRPTVLDPAWLRWRDGTVGKMARTAYEERLLPSGELAGLAILADALEDDGCSDEAMLMHLRDVGPHLRGCWVVDALLETPRNLGRFGRDRVPGA